MAGGHEEPNVFIWITGVVGSLIVAAILGLIKWAFGVHSDVSVLKSQMLDMRDDVKTTKNKVDVIHDRMPKRESDPEHRR